MTVPSTHRQWQAAREPAARSSARSARARPSNSSGVTNVTNTRLIKLHRVECAAEFFLWRLLQRFDFRGHGAVPVRDPAVRGPCKRRRLPVSWSHVRRPTRGVWSPRRSGLRVPSITSEDVILHGAGTLPKSRGRCRQSRRRTRNPGRRTFLVYVHPFAMVGMSIGALTRRCNSIAASRFRRMRAIVYDSLSRDHRDC